MGLVLFPRVYRDTTDWGMEVEPVPSLAGPSLSDESKLASMKKVPHTGRVHLDVDHRDCYWVCCTTTGQRHQLGSEEWVLIVDEHGFAAAYTERAADGDENACVIVEDVFASTLCVDEKGKMWLRSATAANALRLEHLRLVHTM